MKTCSKSRFGWFIVIVLTDTMVFYYTCLVISVGNNSENDISFVTSEVLFTGILYNLNGSHAVDLTLINKYCYPENRME